MSRPEFNEREISASLLTHDVGEITGVGKRGLVTGDLVRAVVNAETFSRPLDRVADSDENYLARAWRFLVPAQEAKSGLTIVQFAQSTIDIDGLPNAIAGQGHVDMFDREIMLNENPSVRYLFRTVGGSVASKLHENDAPFFAGLEHRYRAIETPEGTTYADWVQLVYPTGLQASTEAMKERIKLIQMRKMSTQKWMERAADVRNRSQTAANMALSALWSFENLQVQ